ncbi:hypothetical protein TNCV_1706511 [Trichonephila clavipes]|uniref:Uncharacterized protein n=1 Tax=Trichonephila clavipes TaxID=2585209 RepID=A0A8X6RCZ7_TRICX|nr:hypothetical protein TNCV_1706511 [Trichonephila clavipes]
MNDSKRQQCARQLDPPYQQEIAATSTEKRSNDTQAYWRCITVAVIGWKNNLSFRKSNRKNNFLLQERGMQRRLFLPVVSKKEQKLKPLMTGLNRYSFRLSRLRHARRSCGLLGR